MDALGKFERRIHLRLRARTAISRVGASLPAIVQILVAVAAAYSLAHWGLGHATPLLAVTVTISSLGFARDARPRRVAESLLGILLGVGLADVLSYFLGSGLWQLVLVLLTVFVVGRAISPNPAFAVAAGIPSALVMLLAEHTVLFSSTLDALTGGATALLATALVPRDPRRTARRDGRAVFSVFAESLGSIVDCLQSADAAAGELALERLRRTQGLIDGWATSLDTAISVARISPFLRHHLPELRRQARVQHAADLTARHLRSVARRAQALARDGETRPRLASIVRRTAVVIHDLGADDSGSDPAVREALLQLSRRLDPLRVTPGAGVADAAIVLQLRPLVIDLLVATGMPVEQARAALPTV
jgi:uncharacterized membrane protein YgaE (UPF0421/DUF939 family)